MTHQANGVHTLLRSRCDRPFRTRRIIHHCPPCTLAAVVTVPRRTSMMRRR